MIDQDNEQVGIVDTPKALEMARAAGLDLVEVAPQARPPVCRIMDYGKWKYQQRKKEQKAKSHAKQSELKEVRLRPKTDEHDMELKTERARRFLGEGHKVQFTMLVRGREMAHREIGFSIFQQLADDFQDVAKLEVAPRVMGRRMTMIVAPASKPKGGKQTKESQQQEQAPRPRIDRSVRQSAAQQAAAQRVAKHQDADESDTD